MHSLAVAVSLGLPLLAKAQSYTLTTTYQGSNFFQQWNFSTAIDVNYGNVHFVDYNTATQQKLAYIDPATGHAILKIDNTTVGNPADNTFGRNSLYLTSNAAINVGSLILFDAYHVPFGCSVWPAFFTQGAGVTWPQHGEIDIFENVNQATTNQYSLHTLDGCTHPSASSGETGSIVSTDCFNATNGNEGCIVKEAQANSFGAGFNNNGGGAYATLFDNNGIKTWFFQRANVPSDFNSDTPNPASWGTPSAYFPSSACNITQFFGPQTMILDIDVCGAFGIGAFTATCQGNCEDLVRDPANYNDAWFDIASIRVFTENSGGASVTGPIPSGPSAAKSSGTASPTSGGGKSAATSFRLGSPTLGWALGAVVSTALAGAFSLWAL